MVSKRKTEGQNRLAFQHKGGLGMIEGSSLMLKQERDGWYRAQSPSFLHFDMREGCGWSEVVSKHKMEVLYQVLPVSPSVLHFDVREGWECWEWLGTISKVIGM